jgi:hypothetical protein
MRIFDVNNIEIISPDLSRGYFKKDKIFVKHHEAVEPVEEQWHYEVVAEYPNGGKDIKKVIDVVGVKAQDPWDEYEDIRRYVEYPENEVTDELNNPTISQRLDKIEKTLQEFSKHIENYKNNYTDVGR